MSDLGRGKAPSEKGRREVSAAWGADAHLPLQFVDNMKLVGVNDQVYLTFGQIDFSEKASPTSPDGSPTSALIQPLARFVLTRQALARIAHILSEHAALTDPDKQ